jgi:hypothetical protein
MLHVPGHDAEPLRFVQGGRHTSIDLDPFSPGHVMGIFRHNDLPSGHVPDDGQRMKSFPPTGRPRALL